RRFLRGKKKFNLSPKKGVQYLVENGLLDHRGDSVAEFLYKEEGLNKTAIGNFLGEKYGAGEGALVCSALLVPDGEELNLLTLKAFVGLHEFSDLNLVQALRSESPPSPSFWPLNRFLFIVPLVPRRQFLWSFRLPGEAQKIDRMMEAFATRYCECNAGVFQSTELTASSGTDTCYILSFSIVMLNTTLHNPNVKDKPNLQRFVSMNREINNGEDLPTELLTKLYASIRNEPLKFPEDDGNDLTLTFFNPDREGWLLKMGGRVKTWKRRWFILTDSCLYYFEYTTVSNHQRTRPSAAAAADLLPVQDKDPIGIIPLEDLCVRKLQDSSKPYCLELYNPKGQKIKACKMESRGGVVQGKHQSYTLSAASEDERDSWMQAISASVTKNPLFDLVSVRKRKV
ncbi:unnamed protein product, partial [Tetraodon nigroviridis]